MSDKYQSINIINERKPKCMTVNSTTNGAPIVSSDCNAHNKLQNFIYDPKSKQIIYDNKCIEASGAYFPTAHIPLQLWDCLGAPTHPYQQWNFDSDHIMMESNNTACIERSDSQFNGTPITVAGCNVNNEGQDWKRQPTNVNDRIEIIIPPVTESAVISFWHKYWYLLIIFGIIFLILILMLGPGSYLRSRSDGVIVIK